MKRVAIKPELARLLLQSEQRVTRALKVQEAVFRVVLACYGLTSGRPLRVEQEDDGYILVVAEESDNEASS